MLTECPSCLTVFRVTGAILKIGHGQVRCGKCRTQFDALESLLDEENSLNEVSTGEAVLNNPAEETSAIEAREPDIAEEITLEGSRIEISGTYRVLTDDDTQTDASHSQIIREHVVIDRDAPADHDVNDDDNEDSENASDEEIEVSADDGEAVADAANHLLADVEPHISDVQPSSQRIWKRSQSDEQHLGLAHDPHSDPIHAELTAHTQVSYASQNHRGRWTIASIVLAIALLAQTVHHYRDPLVRDPRYGGAISNIYRALGLTLTPHWDLSSYELQQWGVVLDGAARDALRVRASVTNGANFAQPYPLIKLALEDRWGAPVAMREFLPAEYLPSSAAANRMMAPRQRTNAEIVIVDPGVDAVGFQLHACLSQDNGIVCYDDLSAKKAP